MELEEAMTGRRSVRRYTPRRVPEQAITTLVDAARQAPFSCNLQVYKLILIDSPRLRKELAEKVTGKVRWTNQLFAVLVDRKLVWENHANYISVGMAIQNLMLRAHSLGLATCPIAGFGNKRFLKKRLGVPERYDIPLLVFLGHSDEPPRERPYRCPAETLYAKNRYRFDDLFPTDSDIARWPAGLVGEYRRRIFSVYFPRFSHGIYRGQLDAAYRRILPELTGRRTLGLFLWEKELFDRMEGEDLHVADIVPEYLEFLKKTGKAKGAYRLEDTPKGAFDRIVSINTLLFQQDLDQAFACMKRSLRPNGRIYLAEHSPWGSFGLAFRTLRLIGLQRDVYHDSPFYKIGPWGFVGSKSIRKLAREHGLSIISKEAIRTGCLERRARRPAAKALVRAVGALLPETRMYVLGHAGKEKREGER